MQIVWVNWELGVETGKSDFPVKQKPAPQGFGEG